MWLLSLGHVANTSEEVNFEVYFIRINLTFRCHVACEPAELGTSAVSALLLPPFSLQPVFSSLAISKL